MPALTAEQRALKWKITTGAIAWGVIVCVIVALLSFWLLGNAGEVVRWIGAVMLGGGLGYAVFRWRYNSGVARAVCRKCGTAFGIREVERREAVLNSEQRQKVELLRPAAGAEPGLNKVITWTEEKVEITAIDECFNCHDRTERKWTVTREQDRSETEVPIAPAVTGLAGPDGEAGGSRPPASTGRARGPAQF